MDKISEAILALEPVTFRYKEELDPDNIPQFGLIAEQVEKVDPDLVVKDEEGNVSTVPLFANRTSAPEPEGLFAPSHFGNRPNKHKPISGASLNK